MVYCLHDPSGLQQLKEHCSGMASLHRHQVSCRRCCKSDCVEVMDGLILLFLLIVICYCCYYLTQSDLHKVSGTRETWSVWNYYFQYPMCNVWGNHSIVMIMQFLLWSSISDPESTGNNFWSWRIFWVFSSSDRNVGVSQSKSYITESI